MNGSVVLSTASLTLLLVGAISRFVSTAQAIEAKPGRLYVFLPLDWCLVFVLGTRKELMSATAQRALPYHLGVENGSIGGFGSTVWLGCCQRRGFRGGDFFRSQNLHLQVTEV